MVRSATGRASRRSRGACSRRSTRRAASPGPGQDYERRRFLYRYNRKVTRTGALRTLVVLVSVVFACAPERQERRPFLAVRRDGSAISISHEGDLAFAPDPRQPDTRLELATMTPAALGDAWTDADGTVVVPRHETTERLRLVDGGIEQSWEFPARPRSRTAIRIAVRGLEHAHQAPDGHHFADSGRRVAATYGRATWIDAAGKRTDVPVRSCSIRTASV
jgi:hypothetical protein